MSREEAAERLAMPAGTVSSRVARGRKLLREKLLRRGCALSLAALVAALASEATAAVPPTLERATTASALYRPRARARGDGCRSRSCAPCFSPN